MYILSPQAGRLCIHSNIQIPTTQRNEAQTQQSSTAISPSLKYSRSLGYVMTLKLKSMSTPSTPATDVSFEQPPENVVLQGRLSSFRMNDSNDNPLLNELESHDVAKSMSVLNLMGGNITTDDANEVLDVENDREYGETSPLIDERHSSQQKTRNRQKPQHKVASGCSYNSIKESKPLLAEDSDECNTTTKTASSSWFS